MKNRTKLLFAIAVLFLLVSVASFGGVFAKYITKVSEQPLTVTIDGRTYTKATVTSQDTQAYTISDDGILTVKQFFFVPLSEGSLDGEWFITTGIGVSAFANNSEITEAVLPDSVTTLNKQCFQECTNLAKITIPAGVQKIPNYAFRDTALKSLTLPDGITEIGENAFQRTALVSLTLPNSLTKIGTEAFADCASLTELNLPNTNVTCGSRVFRGIGAQSITIPASFPMGFAMFKSCKNLSEVVLSEGITALPESVFQDCASLKTITLPSTLERIESAAFISTLNGALTIPDGVTFIASNAFQAYNIPVVFYNGTAEGAPWGINKGIIVNYEKLGVTPTFESGDATIGVQLSLGEGFEHEVITAVATDGKKTNLNRTEAGFFMIPAAAYAADKVVALEIATGYSYAVLDSENILHMYADMESYPAVGDPLPTVGEGAAPSGATVQKLYMMPTAVPGDLSVPGALSAWDDDARAATAVVVETPLAPADTKEWFKGFASCTSFDLALLDTSNVTDMSGMFNGCSLVTALDLSHFDTARVTSLASMFRSCTSLQELNLSGFQTENVTTMTELFYACSSLTTLDLSDFSNAGLTNTMTSMFYAASNLETVFVGELWEPKWDDAATATPFINATDLKGSNGTLYSGSYTGANYARVDNDMGKPGYFTYKGRPLVRSAIEGISVAVQQINEDSVVLTLTGSSMPLAVRVTSSLAAQNDRSLSVQEVDGIYKITIPAAFYTENQIITVMNESASAFACLKEDGTLEVHTHPLLMDGTYATFIDKNGVEVKYLIDQIYSVPTAVEEYSAVSRPSWTTVAASVTRVVFADELTPTSSTASWFANFEACTEIDLTNLDTSRVTNMSRMFSACYQLQSIDFPESFVTSSVTNMYMMFQHVPLTSVVFPETFDLSWVQDMGYMFSNCTKLKSITFPENLQTSSLSNTGGMFNGCSALEHIVFPNGFNTQNVINMQAMFNHCRALTSIQWSASFNTQNVQNMQQMFANCEALESLDLTHFNTQSVTNMKQMFSTCKKLTTVTVGYGWSTVNVEESTDMFLNCTLLVGCNNTGYDETIVDKTYARIDKPGVPGYLTGEYTTYLTVVLDPSLGATHWEFADGKTDFDGSDTVIRLCGLGAVREVIVTSSAGSSVKIPVDADTVTIPSDIQVEDATLTIVAVPVLTINTVILNQGESNGDNRVFRFERFEDEESFFDEAEEGTSQTFTVASDYQESLILDVANAEANAVFHVKSRDSMEVFINNIIAAKLVVLDSNNEKLTEFTLTDLSFEWDGYCFDISVPIATLVNAITDAPGATVDDEGKIEITVLVDRILIADALIIEPIDPIFPEEGEGGIEILP